MADFKKLKPFIRQWEGGFSNDPHDKGGATLWGVTIATYRTYRKSKGYKTTTVDDLKKMTEEEWDEIFKTLYWDKWKGDEIQSQSVANILVDWVWASGVYGIKNPQRLLGVAADGIVGPKTIEALNAQNPHMFFEQVRQDRFRYIDAIIAKTPTNQKFKKGWYNRINDFVFVG